MTTLEACRNAEWFAAVVSCAMLACGGNIVTTDATGGKGGSGGSSSSGAAGSTVSVGTGVGGFGSGVGGGMVGTGTSTGTSTSTSTSTGTGTSTSTGTTTGTATSTGTGTGTGTGSGAGGSGGGCGGFQCCDPTMWPGNAPPPIEMPVCSDFDSDSGAEGIHCILPGGVWSVDVDGAGTAKQDSYKIEPCGTTGNGFHFVGKGHSVWGADAAVAIVSQTQPVDVSAYTGMSFVMKSTTPNVLIFKVQNSYSQPPCGKCDDVLIGAECYSGYIKVLSLPANDVAPLVVRWADLAQQSWGYRPPGSAVFDPRDLISVAFAFDKNVDFDVCIDDVKFVR